MTFFDRFLRRDAEVMTRRATAATSSWNPESRSFEVCLSAGAPVERHDTRGAYAEVLDLNGARLPDRVPLLDAHGRDGMDRVLGHVEALRVEGGQLRGRAVLSRHNPAAIRLAGELTDGARFAVSVGYRVGAWRDGTDGTKRTRTATAWDLLEASLVPVGADPDAGTRGTETMPTSTPAPGSRAQINSEIRTLATTAGLDRAWIDAQIDAESTLDQARAAAFEAMRQRSDTTSRISTVSHTRDLDDREGRIAAMGEALYCRVTPSHRPSERARQYVGLRIPDLAREDLRSAGISTTGLSDASVIARIGMHTTSDFPQVLGDAVGRTLRAAYTAAPSALRQLARQRTATDFRMQHRLWLSAGGFSLQKVNEAGEFHEGTLVEGGEAYKIETFGRIFSISRQAIVNDSIGAFSDLPRTLGSSAAALEADVLAAVLNSNPVMSDGQPVFSAAHNNVGTPADITLDSLSEARTAMRRQTGPGGELLNVVPRFLVVSPEEETVAEQALAEIAAATADTVNVFANRLTLIVDPRLSGGWYLVADPASVDGLEYATLEGEGGPQVVTENGFDVDGLRIRVRHDWGAGWVDWRGWFRNPGA